MDSISIFGLFGDLLIVICFFGIASFMFKMIDDVHEAVVWLVKERLDELGQRHGIDKTGFGAIDKQRKVAQAKRLEDDA